MSAMDKVAELVKTLGFPIVIACWLLYRTDKRLEKAADLLQTLITKIDAWGAKS
jgi:hypothetical protein